MWEDSGLEGGKVGDYQVRILRRGTRGIISGGIQCLDIVSSRYCKRVRVMRLSSAASTTPRFYSLL